MNSSHIDMDSILSDLPSRTECDYFQQEGCPRFDVDVLRILNVDNSAGVGA